MSHEKFQNCIDACVACAVECEHCATSCLNEDMVKDLTKCIALDRECASVCRSAAELMSIGGVHATLLCQVCADICDACAEECERHSDHMDHCRECAEECRRCSEECRMMIEQHV
jgi:hypothetical protein